MEKYIVFISPIPLEPRHGSCAALLYPIDASGGRRSASRADRNARLSTNGRPPSAAASRAPKEQICKSSMRPAAAIDEL